MKTGIREQKIISILESRGEMSVSALSEYLGVSVSIAAQAACGHAEPEAHHPHIRRRYVSKPFPGRDLRQQAAQECF